MDPHVGKRIVGQDLMAGYPGQDGVHYQLYVSESVVLRLDEPRAICTIRPRSYSLRSTQTSLNVIFLEFAVQSGGADRQAPGRGLTVAIAAL